MTINKVRNYLTNYHLVIVHFFALNRCINTLIYTAPPQKKKQHIITNLFQSVPLSKYMFITNTFAKLLTTVLIVNLTDEQVLKFV